MKEIKKYFLIIGLTFLVLVSSSCNSNKDESRLRYDLKDDSTSKEVVNKMSFREEPHLSLSLPSPSAITIDHEDSIFVAGDGVISKYHKNFEKNSSIAIEGKVTALGTSKNGLLYAAIKDTILIIKGDLSEIDTSWQSINKKSWITSLIVTEKDIFLGDAVNKVVLRYSKEGKLINRIGEKDTSRGIPGLIVPSPYLDIAEGLSGEDIWVVNPGRHSLENYNFEGKLISSWERASFSVEGFCGCCNPSHIALQRDGSFVTSEKGLPRVKIHEPNGNLRTVIANTDSFFEETKGMDIAIDSEGKIFVLDPIKKSVRVFRKVEKNG